MDRLLMTIMLALAVVPAAPQQNVSAGQTIATWNVTDEDGHSEYSLMVDSGVLELREVEFCESCGPQGDKKSLRVKLVDVRRFDKNTFAGGASEFGIMEPAHRIGITTRGDHDLVQVNDSGRTRTRSGMPGFAIFAIDQQKLRDEVYVKLCALIGQKP